MSILFHIKIHKKAGTGTYLSWRVCYRMLQKSHHHHHRHQRGQWVLGGTSFSLEWAAWAYGDP